MQSRAMVFRFLHMADLHLDSPLRSLALRDAALADLVAEASRHALRASVDLALAERLDAVLIAGDLYDGSQTSMKTARYLAAEMARLDQGGVRVFIIRGNHDAISTITRELTLPPNVHVFGSHAEVVRLETPTRPVAVHGMSFRDRHAPESLLPHYGKPMPDALNLGLMHTSLNGAPGHDLYAPCALHALHETGYDYWALGHIHKRAVYPGPMPVVMPGIPQGRDMGETGAGSVTLVTCGPDGVRLEERVVALASFAPVVVDVRGLEDWHDLRATIEAALEGARGAAPHLIARLTLRGATPLAARLLRDRDLALAEAQDIARGLGQVWVESLRLDLGGAAPVRGAAMEALAGLVGDVRAGAAFADALEMQRRELEAALPPEARDAVAALPPEALEEALGEIFARISEGRG